MKMAARTQPFFTRSFWMACLLLGAAHASDAPPTRAILGPPFVFNSIAEMTTCQPAFVSWDWAGSSATLQQITLQITNYGVSQLTTSITATSTVPFNPVSTAASSLPQSPLVPRHKRDLGFVTQNMTASPIDVASQNFTWPLVTVSAGWYMLVATFANSGTTSNSLSFVIQNGATTACSASSSTAASSSSSSTSASASSSTPPPSQVAASTGGGKGVNRGAIAGAVVGSLAVVAAAIAVFFYFRYAAKGKPSDATTSSGSSKKRSPRRWAGDAKAYPSGSGIGIVAGHHHSQSDSIGPILTSSRPSQSQAYGGGDGELDSGSYFSPSQEKISSSPVRSPFSDSGHYALGELERNAVPLEYIGGTPPEGGAGGLGRSSSTSTASHLHMNFSRPRSHPGSPYGSASSPTNESPGPSSPTPSSQAHQRNSIGDSLSGSKRMARKPVPQYNPADPSLASVPSAPSSSSSSREGSVRAAGGTSPHLHHDWPVLEHKSSFGQDGRPVDGRPVHYLIPDMPSSQA